MNFQPCGNPVEEGESGGDCFIIETPMWSHGLWAHTCPRDTNKFKGLVLRKTTRFINSSENGFLGRKQI